MSGPKRNPDQLNTIGIVVVGICGAVLVYVTIVALQAFYMNDTSEVQTMADYNGNDSNARSIKTAQIQHLTDPGSNPVDPKKGVATYHINIDDAMRLVVEGAKVDPSNLVPTEGRSDKPTAKPIYGRPQKLDAPVTPPTDGGGAGSGSATPPPVDGAGAGSGATTGPSVPPAGQGSGAGSAATPPPAGAGAGSGSAAPAPKAGAGAGSGSAALAPKAGAGSGSAAPKGNGP